MQIHNLARDTILYALANVISRGLSLAVIPLYVTYLNVSEFGFISLFQLYLSLGIVLLIMGLDQALLRFIPQTSSDKRQQLFSTTSLFLLLLSVILIPVFWGFKSTIARILFKDSVYASETTWLIIIIILEILTQLCGTVFRADQKPTYFLRNAALKFGMFLCCNFILFRFFGRRIDAVVISYFIANTVYIIFSAGIWRKDFKFQFSFSVLKEMLQFGLPLVPNVLLALSMFYIDHYLLKVFRDLETVGLYAFGYKIGGALYYIVAALNNAWLPVLYRLKKEEVKKVLNRVLLWVMCGSIIAYIIIENGFRTLHPHFLPLEYWQSVSIISWIGLAYIIYNVSSFIDSVFYYVKQVKVLTLISSIGAGLNIILNLFLIPGFGMNGAVIATCLSFGVVLISTFILIRKRTEIQIDGIQILFALISLGLVFGFSRFVNPSHIWLKIGTVFGLVIVFIGLHSSLSKPMRREWNLLYRYLQKRVFKMT